VEPLRVIMILALSVFLVEGFALSVFPAQFKQLLLDADPRALQAAGLAETVIAVGLMAAVLFG
jgi:uncharacterized protein YjeT (DUF2065 family)